jgi:hypothetical protein
VSDTIRLFVGTAAQNEDLESQAVLEWSVRKHTKADVEIVWMQQSKTGPWSGWNADSWRTPFTGFRWALPSVCNYEGRAIYTDSDFVFMADIADLWNQPIPKMALVRNPTGKVSTSCILFDCAKAKGIVPGLDKLRAKRDAHGEMLNLFRANPEQYFDATEGNWDCGDLRGYELNDPRVKAIHYTRMSTQPQLKHATARLAKEGRAHWYTGETAPHPSADLQQLFDQLLIEAEANGYGIERYRVTPFGGAKRSNFSYKEGTARQAGRLWRQGLALGIHRVVGRGTIQGRAFDSRLRLRARLARGCDLPRDWDALPGIRPSREGQGPSASLR